MILSAGCAPAEEETPMPKEPPVTAEENAERLKNAKIPEEAKKIIGGSVNQNKAGE
jgi:hypothetical protein